MASGALVVILAGGVEAARILHRGNSQDCHREQRTPHLHRYPALPEQPTTGRRLEGRRARQMLSLIHI
eukprot:13883107-Alexandrium_andersonii.AAC.1